MYKKKFDCYKLLFIEGTKLNEQHTNNYKMNSTTFNNIICWFFENTEATRDEIIERLLEDDIITKSQVKDLIAILELTTEVEEDLFNETEDATKETEATEEEVKEVIDEITTTVEKDDDVLEGFVKATATPEPTPEVVEEVKEAPKKREKSQAQKDKEAFLQERVGELTVGGMTKKDAKKQAREEWKAKVAEAKEAEKAAKKAAKEAEKAAKKAAKEAEKAAKKAAKEAEKAAKKAAKAETKEGETKKRGQSEFQRLKMEFKKLYISANPGTSKAEATKIAGEAWKNERTIENWKTKGDHVAEKWAAIFKTVEA